MTTKPPGVIEQTRQTRCRKVNRVFFGPDIKILLRVYRCNNVLAEQYRAQKMQAQVCNWVCFAVLAFDGGANPTGLRARR